MTTLVAPSFPDLAERYQWVRSFTERLADPLSPEDQAIQSMPDVSPTKWHRAHTTWFFETFVLGPHHDGYAEFQEGFGFLFNSYYETVGERHARARRGMISRPSAADISYYRQYVDEAMASLMAASDDDDETVRQLIELGLHHEQQHQELLLMDIKHVLAQNPLWPAYRDRPAASRTAARPLTWRRVTGGVVSIGTDGPSFAFDNETPRHDRLVSDFELGDRLVTCGEWLEFMSDGGYDTPTLWLSDGWIRVQEDDWRAPLYWDRDDEGWHVFTLHGRRPVDPGEPVCHVSHYEADAFARWAGARLPTEVEWEHAVRDVAVSPRHAAPNGVLHPVGSGEAAAMADVHGEAWQWTSSAYLGFPGFRAAPGAVGEYNGKFMSNQMVLRGSACVTPPGHARLTYRNFFPPHSRWMFSGVRLARDLT